jgi:hypothetical protein
MLFEAFVVITAYNCGGRPSVGNTGEAFIEDVGGFTTVSAFVGEKHL